MNIPFLKAMTTEDLELLFFVFGEREQNFLLPAVSAKYKRRIYKSVLVLDFKGVNVMATYMKLKKLFKASSRIMSDYYPETLHKMIIINAGKVDVLEC